MWLPEVMTSTPAANNASAVETVRPIPPATFSPFAVTKSMPRSSRIPARACSTATRPGLPMMSPIMRIWHAPGGRGASPFAGFPSPARSLRPITIAWVPWARLLRVLDGARLADDGDLDLARVGQVVLDLLDDVTREARRGEVVDLLGVCRDPVDDLERHRMLLGDARADRGVRPLNLVVDRLADVVQQAANLRRLDVRAQLGRDDRRDVARLDGVDQHVLPVRCPVLQPSEELEEVRRKAGDAGVVRCLLPGLADDQVDLGAGLVDDLLDAAGVDPSVGDQLRHGDPRNLAAHRVEAREDHRLGCVVDDQVDARRLLERPDVAALAADDAALHLVARQVDDGNG